MTECRKPVLKKYAALFLTLALFTSFVACSNLDIKPPEPDQKPVSVLTGKSGGTKLSDLFGQKKDTSNMPVNAFLWRAALDIAKFVPLDDIDTFGGSIVTEWYQSGSQQDQRLKLAFFVSGLELRSDAIIVQTYIQQRAGDSWIDIGSDDQLARRLEDLVLTRARELRAVSLGETTQ
jgi:hypothetical protein